MTKYNMSSKQSDGFLHNKICLITGAAGSIGSALARKIIIQNPRKLILLDNNESDLFNRWEEIKKAEPIVADIRDELTIDMLFEKWKPEYVFHAAAYKHVVMMEKYPLEAIKTNIGGTQNIVQSSIKYGIKKFIFISTDKAVNPESVMGLSKNIGEHLCEFLDYFRKYTDTRFIIVRFGNVLASRGSVVEIFKQQIRENKPLTITDKKMKRFVMGIPEAAELVLKAAQLGRGGERFIFDMGKQMYVEDLAKMMIRLSGKDIPLQYIGRKQGEKFEEQLMTKVEKKNAIKRGHLYVIKKK